MVTNALPLPKSSVFKIISHIVTGFNYPNEMEKDVSAKLFHGG